MRIVIGTAGWSIAAKDADAFGAGGSALERYATRFRGVEINSSFHRSHRPSTWARWADTVPPGFRFSTKLPKTITHQANLVGCEQLLDAYFAEAGWLGDKLAVVLVQLPPKLPFDACVADTFFRQLAERSPAPPACEPRHPSWFDDEADALLARLGVARVAADPALSARAAVPGGAKALTYWRLHGSPVMYRSAYGTERLASYLNAMEADRPAGQDVWCMFDNTASSAAIGDALELQHMLSA